MPSGETFRDISDLRQLLLERDWPGRRQRVLVEVNVGVEPQKAGVLPDDKARADVVAFIRSLVE